MPRPVSLHPTPAQLDVLKVVWEHGPLTVREVMRFLDRGPGGRAYTSVMSLMNVMAEKGLLVRQPKGRAFVYRAARRRDKTLARMVADLCRRAYEGSASTLVTHLLDAASPTERELNAIRRAISEYERSRGTRP